MAAAPNFPIFHENALKRSFSKPWKSSNLVLVVEGRKFHVHREVLIVCSPVFEAMLSTNFKEKSAFEIALPEKKADEIEELLETIYPDRNSAFTYENCFSLLALANEYQIDILKERGEKYLSSWCNEDMTAEEALEVVLFSQKYALEENIVQRCMTKFASQPAERRWDVIKEQESYSELTPANEKRILEERVKFFESTRPGRSPLENALFLCTRDDVTHVRSKPKRTRRV